MLIHVEAPGYAKPMHKKLKYRNLCSSHPVTDYVFSLSINLWKSLTYRLKKSLSRVAVTLRRLSGPCQTGHLDPPIMPREIPSGNGGVITVCEYNSGEHQIPYMICAYQ
jgi:hypothetical protein